MIGEKFNYDEVFFRDLTLSLLDTLEGRVKWINKFSDGDVEVDVPFYYSLSGDERFLLDSFQDDIVSNNRFVELNTDQIPRGHITLTSWNVRSDEFRNPNIWLRDIQQENKNLKSVMKKVRAIPISANYDLTILLKTEIDVFKCNQAIMNTLWLYKFLFFEYNYMNIDAFLLMPDDQSIQINREKNLQSDELIKMDLSLPVQTHYPALLEEQEIKPYRTRWFNNIITLREKNSPGGNQNPDKTS